jgi:PHS family inorganic phosphate transporter-like MFS transporter
MLSTVFFGQPLGQLLACIVSLITTSALRHGISGASQTHCTGQCLHTADIAWRWIVGFGAVPPIFALVLRFYIPESPRWLLEVEKNPLGIDAAAYTKEKFYTDPLLDDDVEICSRCSTDGDPTVPGDLGGIEEHLPEPAPRENGLLKSSSNKPVTPQPELESWADFLKSFRIYLFGEELWTWRRLWLCLQFRDQHFFDGSWTDLAGLSSTWFLLDFGFYFLIVNSFKLMTKIWANADPDDVYTVIFQYAWRIIASTSIGAVAGGAIFIAMARNRWKLQFYGFLALVALLVVVGIVFIKLIGGRYFATFIVLYCFCHLAFNLGPNTSTFVVSKQRCGG